MTITGQDDANPDASVSTAPAARPSTVVDIHTLVPELSATEVDAGTNPAHPPALPAPRQQR